jgi:hypothetical protein
MRNVTMQLLFTLVLAAFTLTGAQAEAARGKVIAKAYEEGESGDFVYGVTGAWITNPSDLWAQLRIKGSSRESGSAPIDGGGVIAFTNYYGVRISAESTVECFRNGGSSVRERKWSFTTKRRMRLTNKTTALPISGGGGLCFAQIRVEPDLWTDASCTFGTSCSSRVKMALSIRARR